MHDEYHVPTLDGTVLFTIFYVHFAQKQMSNFVQSDESEVERKKALNKSKICGIML